MNKILVFLVRFQQYTSVQFNMWYLNLVLCQALILKFNCIKMTIVMGMLFIVLIVGPARMPWAENTKGYFLT